MMEQKISFRHELSERRVLSVKGALVEKSDRIRCGLQLGKAMACGTARRREDRAADSEIISDGPSGHHIWLIRSGILRQQRYGYDGRRQILSLFFPGEVIGFELDYHEGVTVEAATQSSLCRIDRRWFDGMVDRNENLRAEMFSQKHDHLDRLLWLTWSLAALKPEERLCAFLVLSSKFMPYQPLPDGTGILSVHLPRKDIADLLGTTVETISRIVHKLSASGILEIKDPTHFRFLDKSKLIEIGKISGFLDKMAVNLSRRSKQLDGFIPLRSDSFVCACGQ